MKKTVVFDFDGVIHSYKSGWRGVTIIPDPPVDGMKECIDDLRDSGYEVVVVSTRCETPDGMNAISQWLSKHDITVDAVVDKKPPAICYVDDRAICFDGNPHKLKDAIERFKPWYR